MVDRYYQPLYFFALSLARNEADACDLTQQTLYVFAAKGHQLRDASKVKSWLFTTLHREFLGMRRRVTDHPHYELDLVEAEIPIIEPSFIDALDFPTLLGALIEVDELYRAPLVLFHLEDNSYKEIASILNIPIGTVMSRLSRAREHLYRILSDRYMNKENTIVPFQNNRQAAR